MGPFRPPVPASASLSFCSSLLPFGTKQSPTNPTFASPFIPQPIVAFPEREDIAADKPLQFLLQGFGRRAAALRPVALLFSFDL
jgi:hypothetical protein